MPLPNPVIAVLGITATVLCEDHPVPSETIWSAVLDDEPAAGSPVKAHA